MCALRRQHYVHRGIEKLSENRDWTQIILLTDRRDYVAAATNNLGYCETVEKLLGVEVPRRARYIRTILAELQRIGSHCLWLGTHAMDIGAMTVLLYAFRERELVLDLFEEYCGARRVSIALCLQRALYHVQLPPARGPSTQLKG